MERLDTEVVTYDQVNAAWPADLPVVDRKTATACAKKLYVYFAAREGARPTGRNKKVVRVNSITRQKYAVLVPKKVPTHDLNYDRRCWASTAQTRNWLQSGWRRMVHDVSHILLHRLNKKALPHGQLHARIERDMIQYVLAQGWVKPIEKPAAPPKSEKLEAELKNARAAIARWETKAKRAATGVKTWRAKEKRILKAMEKLECRSS